MKTFKVIKSALQRLLSPKDYLLLELLKENKKLKAELSNQVYYHKAQQSSWFEDKMYYINQIKITKQEINKIREEMKVPIRALKEFKLTKEQEDTINYYSNSATVLEYDTRNLSVVASDGRVLWTLTVNPEVRKEFGCPMEQEKRYKKLGKLKEL